MEEHPNKPISWRKWLTVVSPCVIAMVLCLTGIIASLLLLNKSAGWSYLGVIILLPSLFVLAALDFVVKAIVPRKPLQIWLAELILIVIGLFVFFEIIMG